MKCLIVLIAYLLSYPSFAATIAQTYQCSGVVHDATGGVIPGVAVAMRQSGMYGPQPFCKRKVRMTELVCANVFGLYWSSELLA